MSNEIIDSVDLNLPPGVLTKMAQKTGLIDKVNEVALLDAINRRLAPKFREMICQQSIQNRKQTSASKTSVKKNQNSGAASAGSNAESSPLEQHASKEVSPQM